MHVMLIDDDQENINELSNLLQVLGHSCDQFVNVYEALENYQSNKYDLVITDLVMPHLDGIEVLKIILQKSPEAIIVVSTAFTNSRILTELLNYGAYAVLPKPLHLNQFIDTIEGISSYICHPINLM